jgi:hypothetical protein
LSDIKLFEQWYVLDEKNSPPVYKLKDPDEHYSNILSRSISNYDLNIRENQEWNEVYNNLIDLFTSVFHEKSTTMKSSHDIQLISAVEILFNYSTKLSPSGCMCVLRQFDGMFFKINDFFVAQKS